MAKKLKTIKEMEHIYVITDDERSYLRGLLQNNLTGIEPEPDYEMRAELFAMFTERTDTGHVSKER